MTDAEVRKRMLQNFGDTDYSLDDIAIACRDPNNQIMKEVEFLQAQAVFNTPKTKQSKNTQDDDLSPKGKPLTDTKESLTGQNDPFPAVPAELKALPQWVMWKQDTREGKPTKVPYQVNGRKAQANNPNTWTDYQTVLTHRKSFSGIGFVFSPDDSYCGIDLDNCLVDGKPKPWAEPIVERLKTVCYAEVSPSGNGIKFWTRAKLPPRASHKRYIDEPTGEAIEAYDRGRYFTVTGKGKGEIKDGQNLVDWLVTEHLKPQPTELPPPLPRSAPTTTINNLTADEVIAKIRNSKQCHKFDALMNGNITGHGSQSEADLALLGPQSRVKDC